MSKASGTQRGHVCSVPGLPCGCVGTTGGRGAHCPPRQLAPDAQPWAGSGQSYLWEEHRAAGGQDGGAHSDPSSPHTRSRTRSHPDQGGERISPTLPSGLTFNTAGLSLEAEITPPGPLTASGSPILGWCDPQTFPPRRGAPRPGSGFLSGHCPRRWDPSSPSADALMLHKLSPRALLLAGSGAGAEDPLELRKP